MENNALSSFSRRKFLGSGTLLMAGFLLDWNSSFAGFLNTSTGKLALNFSHFPSPLHAFIWRNWNLIPLDRLAKVVKAKPRDLIQIAKEMGLSNHVSVPNDQQSRSYLTIIRRNWHLLPREQLLELLDWSDEKLTFTLQEDDFFYIKLGSLKPECKPIRYTVQTADLQEHSKWFQKVVEEEFPKGIPSQQQPLFHFVKELSAQPKQNADDLAITAPGFSPRFGYAYFALFGDPLLDTEIDPYPDGYLVRMAESGMDSTWLHIVLTKLTPFPWDESISTNHQQRLENLKKLVARTGKRGIGIYLYLNEPRFLPLSFFEKHPDLKGVTIGDHAALCTSHPDVQSYLVDSLATITEAIPELAGFFSITASENYTNCWSHGQGNNCPRCSKLGPAVVISQLNALYQQGIEKGIRNYELKSGKKARRIPQLIVWDWGWTTDLAEKIIPLLPMQAALMSVSEWEMDIERGGIKNKVGEYSISSIGPGPRAKHHWEIARKHGLKTIAKIQAGNTWEIAAVPYIPALENVAKHAAHLRDAKVDGLMLGWTLGGYPSPNLEVVSAIGSDPAITPLQAMDKIAKRRYGMAADAVVQAWRQYSVAFSEFPFNGTVVYNAPLQTGPSNLLWEKPTGYAATMVGIPYDDVNAWVGNYPVEIFISQLQKVADGFNNALNELLKNTSSLKLSNEERESLTDECNVAETVAIHYSSAANQARFITIRNKLVAIKNKDEWKNAVDLLEQILKQEIALARRMNILQNSDSRLGFEASNHYFYIPIDLVEKVVNCRDLLDHWIPELKETIV